jgi:hypothetical protein
VNLLQVDFDPTLQQQHYRQSSNQMCWTLVTGEEINQKVE